ncbi:MAG: MMPL family transporter [Lachnospiraceae bacterium]|nr:MMPL family transporter [Lachnospiraceae bacterium]
MNFLAKKIVAGRKPIVVMTFVFLVIMVICAFQVKINYNMADYLPEEANSTKAIDLMSDNFGESMANCSVMIPDVDISEALKMKAELAELPGIDKVEWLDDVADITIPVAAQDKKTTEMYYKDGNALFSVTIAEGHEREGVNAIYDLVGEDAAVTGNAVAQANSQNLAVGQAIKSIMLIGPLIILVLLLSTTSWVEPFLYLTTIGIAVGINWGMQIFAGEMSYVTMAVSPILQMAVSLDYAVFLCSSFEEHKKRESSKELAMVAAIKESFGAIAASAATTLFGFVALIFMDFKIGGDMGVSLVRGVVLSFLAVMLLMPAFLLMTDPLVQKLKHKRILPDFRGCGKVLTKIRVPVLILILVLLIPAYLGQAANSFIYGSGDPAAGSRIAVDQEKMEEVFEDHTIVAMMVPVGNSTAETLLVDTLSKKDYVNDIVSYANMVGNKIPSAYLGKDITSKFYSDKYARIIIYTNTAEEGERAFASIEDIRAEAEKYYPASEIYMCGQSANMYDMKTTIEADSKRVDMITVIAIFIVLMIEFKSLSLPLLLIVVIKIATWINMCLPYFTGEPLAYIGYLVVSTVMMGATIDYAILLTEHYMKARKSLPPIAAMKDTLGTVVKSALVSAMILAVAGFSLGMSSSEQIVKALGLLLGKGAVIAFVLAITLLPAVLLLFDKIIKYTTWKPEFYDGKDEPVIKAEGKKGIPQALTEVKNVKVTEEVI